MIVVKYPDLSVVDGELFVENGHFEFEEGVDGTPFAVEAVAPWAYREAIRRGLFEEVDPPNE